jgi:hypothetical protein
MLGDNVVRSNGEIGLWPYFVFEDCRPGSLLLRTGGFCVDPVAQCRPIAAIAAPSPAPPAEPEIGKRNRCRRPAGGSLARSPRARGNREIEGSPEEKNREFFDFGADSGCEAPVCPTILGG